MTRWRTWRHAMAEALYGEGGFYRSPGAPGAHFRTAAHASPLWADALLRLATRVDEELGRPDDFTLVDLGAGGGELLTSIAAAAPARWRLVAVDVCPRPPGVPLRVEWVDRVPERFTGVLLAVEWLDVVPLDVVTRTDDGLRLVEVDAGGEERAALDVPPPDLEWLARWWNPTDVGDRAEVGAARDEAWLDAVSRLDHGLAIAVDYAADPRRDVAGTLTGYRDGRQVLPVPDGRCDLTAHVLMESCARAVPAAESALLTQRDALTRLGLSGRLPAYAGNPRGYLDELARASEVAELIAADGLGGFAWLLHAKGVPMPL